MTFPNRTFRFLLLSLCAATVQSQTSLRLVYVVNRHGSRNLLPKTATLQDAAIRAPFGDVTLLPLGQRCAPRC